MSSSHLSHCTDAHILYKTTAKCINLLGQTVWGAEKAHRHVIWSQIIEGLVKQCRFSSPPSPILICVETVLDPVLKPEPQQMEKKSEQIKTLQLRVLVEILRSGSTSQPGRCVSVSVSAGLRRVQCQTECKDSPAHIIFLQHQVETCWPLCVSCRAFPIAGFRADRALPPARSLHETTRLISWPGAVKLESEKRACLNRRI